MRHYQRLVSSEGVVNREGYSYNLTRELEDPVCLPFDVVNDCRVVRNFNVNSGHTYVFSDRVNVVSNMYRARVAIDRGRYYEVNYPVGIPRQVEHPDAIYDGRMYYIEIQSKAIVKRIASKVKDRDNYVFRTDFLFVDRSKWFKEKGAVKVVGNESDSLLSSLLLFYGQNIS